MSTENVPIVSVRAVSHRYGDGEAAVWALRDVSLEIMPGQFVALTGPSGSGKSTLLHLVAGLDSPTTGTVLIDGRAVSGLPDRELARLRRRKLALVFQFFNLLPTLTARENVAVPLRADRMPTGEVASRVERAMAAVGIAHRANHFPHQMSGGEMQRVAIARALATDAEVILADEPTGNLDSARGEEILELLKQTTERQGRTVLLVTHDLRGAAYGDRMITLRDGRIVDEVLGPGMTSKVTPIRRP